MARPKVHEPRGCQLNLHLTRMEIEAVRARAAAAGMRVPDYGRVQVLGAASAVAGQAVPSRSDLLLLAQWRAVGVNLNQVARRLNSMPVPMLPPSLEPLLRDIRALIDRELRGP
jgi:hypothetical protein